MLLNPNSRRQFIYNTVAAAAGVSPLGLCIAATNEENPEVMGQGDFRFKLAKDWSFKRDSSPVMVAHCHEFVRLKSGNLILCTTEKANNLIEFSPDGKVIRTFGTTFPGIHGLSLSEENGEEFLWLTDTNRRIVVKLDLTGKELMSLGWPKASGKYEGESGFCPTETAVNPANGDFYVADGYGSDYLLHYTANG